MSSLTVLDCSLRDGGYYTAWNFKRELVDAYLRAMETAGIDAVEIGFRTLQQHRFMGAFAYSTDEYLRQLPLPEKAMIGVMVNANELINASPGPAATIDLLFSHARSSPVDLVRIAVHFSELEHCRGAVRRLKQLGYQVGINLMQMSAQSLEGIAEAVHTVRNWDSVDVLYFADSLGNMNPAAIDAVMQSMREHWSGAIGVHLHDNMNLAMVNALAAVEAGAEWVDCTVLGMGRGAGNTRTELFLNELNRRTIGGYYPEAVYPLALEDFEHLRQRYQWGHNNLLYYLSASYGVHPSYVQTLIGDGHHDAHHVVTALHYLRDCNASSYTSDNLHKALLGYNGDCGGTWDATDLALDEELMLIGAGPQLGEHLGAIYSYVQRRRPVVLCLNFIESFPEEMVNAYVACHTMRLLTNADRFTTSNRPLIMPLNAAPVTVRCKLENVEICDYGMRIEDGVFEASPTYCTIPAMRVLAYALALGMAVRPRRILLAGFDGFDQGDPRQQELIKIFDCYTQSAKAVPLLAVTPTTFPVAQSSIYSPFL